MYRYIVIDDEELTRKGTIAKLEELKSLVSCIGEARDGQEALMLLETHKPDIIITDMNMPNMDGTLLLPILTEHYPHIPIIVISGYKDFEYTKHAIQAKAVDYLLKPFGRKDIQSAIQNAIGTLENTASVENRIVDSEAEKEHACYEYDIQTLKNAILGFHNDNITFTSKKLSHMNNTYQFMLMTLHTEDCLKEEEMQRYLSENGFGDLALYLQHANNKHLGSLILFVPEQSVLDPKFLCEKTAQNIMNTFRSVEIHISIGISNVQNSLTLLHHAFLQTVQALNTKKIHDSNLYYFYRKDNSNNIHLRWEKEEELLFRIEAGMVKEVQKLVQELFQYFRTFPDLSYGDIKFYCFQLSDSTRMIMANYIEQISQTSVSSTTQNILNTMYDLKEMEAYYQQFFANIADVLHDNGIYAIEDVIEKMKIYIQKNYNKNLTVEMLSSFFIMNRSYLSHLFKEKTGEKFVDYLNNIRIEKAKELLATSNKKMYQIAKLVGYDNVKYFFRVFKKKVGKTPEQWRISHGSSFNQCKNSED